MIADERKSMPGAGCVQRVMAIALAAVVCCSCRGPAGMGTTAAPSPTLPQEAFAGLPNPAGPVVPAGAVYPQSCPPAAAPCSAPLVPGPMPSVVTGPWAPPGFGEAWPPGEYLCDGGDVQPTAAVRPDGVVRGLNMEDTVAHYDTPDGQRRVEPSNRVCLYSPRFAAVRQVVSLRQNDQKEGSSGVYQPLRVVQNAEIASPGTSKQQVQAEAGRGQLLPGAFLTRQGEGVVSSRLGPRGFEQNMFKPYENLAAIRLGRVEEAELAWLARNAAAAESWSHKQSVQVILDEKKAAEEVSDRKVGTVYSVKEAPACPKLRLIKVASTLQANPGDPVDFTLRFDNVGNQVIGNVTILDNLSTRLEYEPQSAQCSLEADFATQRNEGQSLVLRWRMLKPLKPGEGGVIRFRCRVR